MRICRNGPIRLHFAGAPAKGKGSSQNQLTASRFFENFRLSSSRQLISRWIFDQRHVNASHEALAGIVCCKTKRWEWTMAHCSGTKSSTCMQRFSLWALSVASSSVPSTVRPARSGRPCCADSQTFGKHGCPCVSAPMGRFARTSLALERKGKEALRNDSQRLASLRSFNACKHETHLEKEQFRQSVRTSCGGLVKLLAPRKRERFSVG